MTEKRSMSTGGGSTTTAGAGGAAGAGSTTTCCAAALAAQVDRASARTLKIPQCKFGIADFLLVHRMKGTVCLNRNDCYPHWAQRRPNGTVPLECCPIVRVTLPVWRVGIGLPATLCP